MGSPRYCPKKGKYTWSNQRSGSEHLAARLDCFLIQKKWLVKGVQLFLKAKLLRHHSNMEELLEGLSEEVHCLSARVSALEITKASDMQQDLGGAGSSIAMERKRTRHSRGSGAVGHGLCWRMFFWLVFLYAIM